ncbi:LysR family transcriptional regulator [Ruminococcaceae bacterium OttesenSCG-928-I18]|nr:LysR family transcriptional regulator [Ruminococcaceae bacterium OttesenSCG-928-I18]
MKELASFLKLCEFGSIRRAAKELYITPQGLSRQINNIEIKLGVPLFVRSSEGLHLTEYGQVFRTYAEKVVCQTQTMEQEILRLRQQNGGVVPLICSFLVVGTYLYTAVEDFQALHPEQKLNITRASDIFVQRQVLEEEETIALTFIPPNPKEFDYRVLQKSPLMLLVDDRSPLSQNDTVSVAELKKQPLILLHEEFVAYHKVVDACKRANIEPVITHTVTGAVTAAKLCKMGKGAAVMMDFLVEGLDLTGIRAIPFDESVGTCDIGIMTKKNTILPASSLLFIEYLSRQMGAYDHIDISYESS